MFPDSVRGEKGDLDSGWALLPWAWVSQGVTRCRKTEISEAGMSWRMQLTHLCMNFQQKKYLLYSLTGFIVCRQIPARLSFRELRAGIGWHRYHHPRKITALTYNIWEWAFSKSTRRNEYHRTVISRKGSQDDGCPKIWFMLRELLSSSKLISIPFPLMLMSVSYSPGVSWGHLFHPRSPTPPLLCSVPASVLLLTRNHLLSWPILHPRSSPRFS